jgi:hypothetical protein
MGALFLLPSLALTPVVRRWPFLRPLLDGAINAMAFGAAILVVQWGLGYFGVKLHWLPVVLVGLLAMRNAALRIPGAPEGHAGS